MRHLINIVVKYAFLLEWRVSMSVSSLQKGVCLAVPSPMADLHEAATLLPNYASVSFSISNTDW